MTTLLPTLYFYDVIVYRLEGREGIDPPLPWWVLQTTDVLWMVRDRRLQSPVSSWLHRLLMPPHHPFPRRLVVTPLLGTTSSCQHHHHRCPLVFAQVCLLMSTSMSVGPHAHTPWDPTLTGLPLDVDEHVRGGAAATHLAQVTPTLTLTLTLLQKHVHLILPPNPAPNPSRRYSPRANPPPSG